MLLPEVGATVSVLLGFPPPVMLSAAGSSKLKEVLIPNPLTDLALFVLEVIGVDDPLVVDTKKGLFRKALKNIGLVHIKWTLSFQMKRKYLLFFGRATKRLL
ncbi:uncharacterized protein LOC120135109 [Hibiscus syriacus]|uniref:uncharacterized protein LOC120135109 n=1 Tax=Hibiscus syriacus TaxID=106335 RepID=UPI001924AEBA|nr:uncharacterized protein LOC120135109 [Hibiscus syriacus]